MKFILLMITLITIFSLNVYAGPGGAGFGDMRMKDSSDLKNKNFTIQEVILSDGSVVDLRQSKIKEIHFDDGRVIEATSTNSSEDR